MKDRKCCFCGFLTVLLNNCLLTVSNLPDSLLTVSIVIRFALLTKKEENERSAVLFFCLFCFLIGFLSALLNK